MNATQIALHGLALGEAEYHIKLARSWSHADYLKALRVSGMTEEQIQDHLDFEQRHLGKLDDSLDEDEQNKKVDAAIAARHSKQSAGGMVPNQYSGMSVQQYLPTAPRRGSLTPEEELQMQDAKSNWLPRIFKSDADSPAVDMASPGKQAVLLALLGALGGGAVGASVAGPVGAGVGAPIGATVGGLVGHYGTTARNRTIEEQMRRVPANGTRRDILSDPVVQQRMALAAQMRQGGAQTGLLGALLATR